MVMRLGSQVHVIVGGPPRATKNCGGKQNAGKENGKLRYCAVPGIGWLD